jgi:hypothetical protein
MEAGDLMGVPIMYGTCEGGPWDKKQLAHHEPSYPVAREEHSRKVVVGIRPGTKGYEFGEYTWKDGTWHWTSAAAVSSRGSSR